MPGYRSSGSTQPPSRHWIVCLNAVWHGPLFCPSVVKSQWTEGVWGDCWEKRMEVRGEENKEGQGWRGVLKGKKKNNRMGMRVERWIFKEKGHDGERWKTRNSPMTLLRSSDIHDFLFQVLPQASSPIWSGTISSVISPYTPPPPPSPHPRPPRG